MYLSCEGGRECKEVHKDHTIAHFFVICREVKTKMSGRRVQVYQSNKALNSVLLDPESNTEAVLDVFDDDQDPGGDEAGVAARADHRADTPAGEILTDDFADDNSIFQKCQCQNIRTPHDHPLIKMSKKTITLFSLSWLLLFLGWVQIVVDSQYYGSIFFV